VNKVRVGLVGLGEIVRGFHLPVMSVNPRVTVVAACGLNPKSVQRIARQYNIPKIYTDFNSLARDAEVDAVLVCVPNNLHAPVCTQMLQNGKHVLCEKPMALSAAEAEKMLAAAAASSRKLAIAHPWRHDQDFRWLRSVIQSGRLGRVFKVRGHAIIVGDPPPLNSWRCNPQISGGGAVMDLGSHIIDTISYLFGDALRPIKVTAQIGNHFGKSEVEDTAAVMIEFYDGMLAVIDCGWHHKFQNSPHGAIEVFGTEGYARTFPTELFGLVDGVRGHYRPFLHAERPHIDASMYAAQMDSFVDCIVSGGEPACGPQQGLRNMRLVDAVYQSARDRQPVSMAEN
jgi:predicted dehydrogenase